MQCAAIESLTSREHALGETGQAEVARKVLVIGGGPAGMKAAVVAAERGHQGELHEKSSRLGGQVNPAEAPPGRAEFGGVTTNLVHELEQSEVVVTLNSQLDESSLSVLAASGICIRYLFV